MSPSVTGTCPTRTATSIFAACLCLTLSCLATTVARGQTNEQYELWRNKLVDDVLVPGGIKNPKVLEAIRTTSRHEFVAKEFRKNAYFDMALPIGAKQTISSPFIVAYMTESLDPQPTDRVLEIGTGSGYQAAVLSPLVKEVYSIEIVELLGKTAATTLKRLRYENVFTKIGDGFQGWEEHAPFDKIIVTCSPEKVPQPLLEQLREGGLMVIPVGERYQQTLYLMRKTNGKLEPAVLRPTLFVPMTGRAEEAREVKPDPRHPKVVNGDFETNASDVEFVPGWYYERLATWETDENAPQGKHYVSFKNKVPGLSAHLLQGIPIDGRHVKEIDLHAMFRARDVRKFPDQEDFPTLAISFFDDGRKEIGTFWLDPVVGTIAWTTRSKKIRVPSGAREAIVRIGLFGATGEMDVDNVQLKPLTASGKTP
ncbi:MAG: Protein-L-isoaspartate O-methyltransferase [Planctomycetota bacterium]